MDDLENSFKIPPSSSPESVFTQLIADLALPMRDIEGLLVALSQPIEASKKSEVLAELELAATNAEWYLSSAVDYLEERKTFSQSEDNKQNANQQSKREELAEGTISLFASVMSVRDIRFYSQICQQDSVSEDEQVGILAMLNSEAMTMVKTYTRIRGNWKVWFEEALNREEFRVRQQNQDILLQTAKEKFLDAGLSGDNEQKHRLYLQSSELFEQAIALGPIPENLVKFAKGAKRWANRYS